MRIWIVSSLSREHTYVLASCASGSHGCIVRVCKHTCWLLWRCNIVPQQTMVLTRDQIPASNVAMRSQLNQSTPEWSSATSVKIKHAWIHAFLSIALALLPHEGGGQNMPETRRCAPGFRCSFRHGPLRLHIRYVHWQSEVLWWSVQSIDHLLWKWSYTKCHQNSWNVLHYQEVDPYVPTLTLNGGAIPQSSSVKYLCVIVDDKLKFHEHMTDRLVTASKRMYVVRRFGALGANSKLVTKLFRSFIESILVYCITILYSNLYTNDKKAVKSFFKRAQFYGAKLDCDVANRVLELGHTYSLRIFHDDDHFIHNVLEKMLSGRIRSHKVQAAIGKEYWHFLLSYR